MLYLYSFCHSLNRAEVFSCLWIDIHGANIISRNLSRDIVAYSSKCSQDLVGPFLLFVLCGRSWRPQGSEKRQRIFLSQTSVIPPGLFCTSYKRRFFLLKEMSTSQQPSKEFLLHFLLKLLFLCSMRCASTSQKDCTSFNAADYIGKDTQGLNFAYGDCSFKNTFCNYTQSCTSGSARNWTTSHDGAVCPGKSGPYDSFSVLLSPLLNITQNTSLVFNYSQTTPGTLSVFIATTTEITEKLKEDTYDVSFHKEVNIEPAVVKICFRARAANTGGHVTLSYVKLQTRTFTSLTTASSTNEKSLTTSHVSARGTSLTASSTGSTHDTSLTTTLAEAGKLETTRGSDIGVTVGVVVAVVVVVAAGVVAGFFMWRHRKQRGSRNNGQEANVKGIYENTGSSEVQSTSAENADSVTYRNLYDALNFEAPTDDIHIYKSVDT